MSVTSVSMPRSPWTAARPAKPPPTTTTRGRRCPRRGSGESARCRARVRRTRTGVVIVKAPIGVRRQGNVKVAGSRSGPWWCSAQMMGCRFCRRVGPFRGSDRIVREAVRAGCQQSRQDRGFADIGGLGRGEQCQRAVYGQAAEMGQGVGPFGFGELVEVAAGEFVEPFRFVVVPGSQLR